MQIVVYNYKKRYLSRVDKKKSTDRLVEFLPGKPTISEEVYELLQERQGVRKQLEKQGFAVIRHSPELVVQERGLRHLYKSIVLRKGSRRITINWRPMKKDGTNADTVYVTIPPEPEVVMGYLCEKRGWTCAGMTRDQAFWMPSEHILQKSAWKKLLNLQEVQDGADAVVRNFAFKVSTDWYFANEVKIQNHITRRVIISWEPTLHGI